MLPACCYQHRARLLERLVWSGPFYKTQWHLPGLKTSSGQPEGFSLVGSTLAVCVIQLKAHLQSDLLDLCLWPSVAELVPGVLRKKQKVSDWDAPEATPAVGRWDATPGQRDEVSATPGRWDATPGGATPGGATPGGEGATPAVAGSRWDATPTGVGATPRRNRWDETPTPGHVSAASSC